MKYVAATRPASVTRRSGLDNVRARSSAGNQSHRSTQKLHSPRPCSSAADAPALRHACGCEIYLSLSARQPKYRRMMSYCDAAPLALLPTLLGLSFTCARATELRAASVL